MVGGREGNLRRVGRARERSRTIELHEPTAEARRRRERCRHDLKAFKRTYFGETCYLREAPFQARRLEAMERLILRGGKLAMAHPRGSAKTTDAMIAALWATLYGHKQFFFIVRANDEDARQMIRDIKREIEGNDLLAADFPLELEPFRALEGAAQRAGQQLDGRTGERTLVEYAVDHLVFARVAGSMASEGVIACAGIGGKIRGRKIRGRRPDFVLLDDIEDHESARSATISAQYRQIIERDIGGLGGPGRATSTIWIGTIIRRGCLTDEFTDRVRHPEWQGERVAALIEPPSEGAMELWREYWRLMAAGKRSGEDPEGKRATAFYRKHRRAMDEGAVVAWPDNYIRGREISALQHLMNWRWEWGEDAFASEMQNDPPETRGGGGLTTETVAARATGATRGAIPKGLEHRLTRFIDVGSQALHFAVVATGEDGSCAVIDYGMRPLARPAGNLRKATAAMEMAMEMAIIAGLRSLRAERETYCAADGAARAVDLTLVDSGWRPNAVYAACREAGPRWQASKGDQAIAGAARFRAPETGRGNARVGLNWYCRVERGRAIYHLDADHWKLETHERLAQAPGTPGAMALFGTPEEHLESGFAEQICNEEYDVETMRWKKVGANHYLDCVAGCLAAAAICGGDQPAPAPKAPSPAEAQFTERGWIERGGGWLRRRWNR